MNKSKKPAPLIIICLFIALLVLITLFPCACCEDAEYLDILIYEHDPDTGIPLDPSLPYHFLEDKEYGLLPIIVSSSSENQIQEIAINVTISTPWGSYINSNDEPEISLITPKYSEYQQFVLTATKDGLDPVKVTIWISKGTLNVQLEQNTIDENTVLNIQITDHQDNPVSHASIQVSGLTQSYPILFTDDGGYVYLNGFSVDENTDILIIASKEGYEPGSAVCLIQNQEILFPLNNTNLTLFLSCLAVIGAMIYVHLKKKRLSPLPLKTSYHKKHQPPIPATQPRNQQKQPLRPITRTYQKNVDVHPRVEIVNIKEYTNRNSPSNTYKTARKHINGNSVDHKTWFTGTEVIRYKIDELAEKGNPVKIEKWFEGTDNIKGKINEKIKKKYLN